MIDWKIEKKNIEKRLVIEDKIKRIIIDSLMLDLDKRLIQNDQPLFGRGLELDSIDALELSIGISTEFGITLSDDDMSIFSSINKLTDYIMENQTEEV
ncbi:MULTISPECIES: phosphopantetheine-binding protein [Lactococcus]|jgi:acyl carrier protein|uniref:Acyl carrier protein n=2 Tax=Lactococcus TaxID=1357 RepID=A0A252CBN5_9LACT|nr:MULTISPECIES: phosphopantetheine-binding protein [Lactococcus]OUK03750.1 acyl carrier protein [Lactococcus petauri]USI65615.1 phosphopantetheine-binding protein [Lactococcus petauri]USI68077.1 phosphopantetheine-binding protein [Lactococcus petauri]USJ20337.1 phosphopantetheine-binding protein [Lactococcus formosensis]WJE12737.1 phosphopantetheine-binding protein [Lactococcus petauri]